MLHTKGDAAARLRQLFGRERAADRLAPRDASLLEWNAFDAGSELRRVPLPNGWPTKQLQPNMLMDGPTN